VILFVRVSYIEPIDEVASRIADRLNRAVGTAASAFLDKDTCDRVDTGAEIGINPARIADMNGELGVK
tara:strand:+ start:69 stop:272 length:204 start_codon:yes stop_codon:yes gene_type:complete